MDRFEGLTLAQEGRLEELREEWLHVEVGTAPCDRKATEAALAELYHLLGWSGPRVLWFSSPAMALLAYSVLKCAEHLGEPFLTPLREDLWQRAWGRPAGQRWHHLKAKLWDQDRYMLWGQFGNRLDERQLDQLWDGLAEQLGRQLWHLGEIRAEGQRGYPVGESCSSEIARVVQSEWSRWFEASQAQLWENLAEPLWLAEEALWVTLGGQFEDQLGRHLWRPIQDGREFSRYWFVEGLLARDTGAGLSSRGCQILDLVERIARRSWWGMYFDGVVILSERPVERHVERQGLLVSPSSWSGPAMRFKDGYAIYSVHGVTVPAWIIEHPERVTWEKALGERNVEVRRVMIERMGDRFWSEANPRILDRDVDASGQPRRLLTVELPDDPDRCLVGVHVRCPSTGKETILRVPPTIGRCDEAVAWTFGMPSEEYRPFLEA